MKKRIWIPLIILVLLVSGGYYLSTIPGHFLINLPVEHKPSFAIDVSQCPSRLSTSGNKLVDANGKTVVLKGVMPADPAVMRGNGNFNQAFFDEIANSGANVVRIAVHPENWERDSDYLWRYLDPLVTWNCQQGLYTIIDQHFIGNIATSSGDHMADIATHSKDFSLAFWRQVAAYFKDAPHVIFDIFNEPAGISSNTWRVNAAELVDAIRSTGAKQLIIIGGVEYSRDLSWVSSKPVPGENLAFAVHIYPGHSRTSWDYWFGKTSQQYPVLVTEWGWMESDPSGNQPYLVGNQETYGQPLLEYLDAHDIGWVACWYDAEWKPAMFQKGNENFTPFGQFVLQRLSGQ